MYCSFGQGLHTGLADSASVRNPPLWCGPLLLRACHPQDTRPFRVPLILTSESNLPPLVSRLVRGRGKKGFTSVMLSPGFHFLASVDSFSLTS